MITWPFGVWLAGAVALTTVWIVRLVWIVRMTRTRAVLGSATHPTPLPRAPTLSIVLAAKDEEANIETCVRSLLEQQYPDFELIVIDDRSRDRTPAILARLQEDAGGRMRVVTVTQLPQGWFGKNNAMHRGVAVSTGEWLLFTDADCRFVAPNALASAMAEALAHGAEFLSVTPVLEAPTIGERILQPVLALVLILWFLPQKVNNPAKRTAYANGQFMLIHRKAYDAIGGHARVRTELNEDIQLARIAKKAGFKLRVVENEDLYHTRMYTSLRNFWHGWTRILVGSLQTPRRLIVAAALLVLFSLVPWIALTISAAGLWRGGVDRRLPWLLAVGAWGTVVFLLQWATGRVYRLLHARPIWSLTYPLGVLAAVAILVNALLRVTRNGVTVWRGTAYRGRTVESGATPATDGATPDPAVPELAPAAAPSLALVRGDVS